MVLLILRLLLLLGLIVFVIVFLAGQWGLLRGKPPATLGVSGGKLAPPSPTPNSVSSQAHLWEYHPSRLTAAIPPLAFTGDPKLAWSRLLHILQQQARVKVLRFETLEESAYPWMWAEATSLVLRFCDDLEFVLDQEASVIHFRFASRLRKSDSGTNRNRAEAIRRAFSPHSSQG